jgi:hypothetical protein
MPRDEAPSSVLGEATAMNSRSHGETPLADLEIVASVRAAEAAWQRTARARTITTGDLEIEELREQEPEHPDRGRTYRPMRLVWRFRGRLADMLLRKPS